MVMPNAAIDREHYAGFRTGNYNDQVGEARIAFGQPWDLRRIRPHFFPRASCVVFGTRTDYRPGRDPDAIDIEVLEMPEEGEIWTGRLQIVNAPWSTASQWLKRTQYREPTPRSNLPSSESPYGTEALGGKALCSTANILFDDVHRLLIHRYLESSRLCMAWSRRGGRLA